MPRLPAPRRHFSVSNGPPRGRVGAGLFRHKTVGPQLTRRSLRQRGVRTSLVPLCGALGGGRAAPCSTAATRLSAPAAGQRPAIFFCALYCYHAGARVPRGAASGAGIDRCFFRATGRPKGLPKDTSQTAAFSTAEKSPTRALPKPKSFYSYIHISLHSGDVWGSTHAPTGLLPSV